MNRTGDIEPGRLEELLAGAPPVGDDERDMLTTILELRALEPPASEDLRARIAAIAAAPPPAAPSWADRLRRRFAADRGPSRRRMLAVGAPVAAALLAAAIIVPTALNDSPSGGGAGVDMAAVPADSSYRAGSPQRAAPAATTADDESAAPPPAAEAPAAVPEGAIVPSADRGRAQTVTAWTRVRVADVAALSRASSAAMDTVRSLGGHTATSDYDVPNGARGQNRLVFRVPVSRVDEAISAFGALGTVTGQDAQIVDVTARLATGADAVSAQRRRVAALRAERAAAPGDTAVAARLDRAERRLASLVAQRDALADRAAMAVVRLDLTTDAPAPAPEDESRIVAALADSWDRLAGMTAWTLGALLLVAPFAALAALALWIASRMRRASHRRLLRM